MRALVVYAHPREGSFTSAVRDTILACLSDAGAEVRLIDLYARNFDPLLSPEEFACYEDESRNCINVRDDAGNLMWCDTLIFVYPTWWYGLPAILKGWLDRVMVPGKAFLMPDGENGNIRPGLTHITRLGAFTTCGASWWLTTLIGSPGRRTLLRGVRAICSKRCRTAFAAHYLMDSSTEASRKAHLQNVCAKMQRFVGRKGPTPQPQEARA